MGIKVPIPTRIGPCYPRCAPTYGQGGRGSRAHRLVSGLLPGEEAVSNGLLNNLIIFLAGNENPAVEPRLMDLHTHALHLNDVNTVTSNPGIVYSTARQYTIANTEYHTRPGDDALLSTGDVDFTVASWVYLDAKATSQEIVAKYNYAVNQREYLSRYVSGSDRFEWHVSSNGTDDTGVVANNLGSPSATTWYLLVAYHDAVNNQLGIQVNNGAVDTQAYALGVHDGTSLFEIGRRTGAGPNYFGGRIGPSMMWKSAAGGGGVLTAVQKTALYNGGLGLPYASFAT